LTLWWEGQHLRADMAYKAGVAAERRGELDQALERLATSTALWPHEPVYWHELAQVHLARARAAVGDARGEYRAAVQAVDRARALAPTDARLWSIWGSVAGEAATSLGDAQLAARAGEAHAWATSHAPTYWLVWRASGATALLQGDYEAAAERFRRAAALYDGD